MASKLAILALLACVCGTQAQFFNPFGGGFGGYNPWFGPHNSAYANSNAQSLFGPANANSVAISNGWGSNTASANSQASSVFGPASANSVAIAGRRLQGMQYGYNPYGGFGSPFLGGLFGGNTNAFANANSQTLFGDSNAQATAIAQGQPGLFGGWAANTGAFSNAAANSVFGDSNAGAVSIANGPGSNTAAANSQASSVFGSANANSVAIAGRKMLNVQVPNEAAARKLAGFYFRPIFFPQPNTNAFANANAQSIFGPAAASAAAIANGQQNGFGWGGRTGAYANSNAQSVFGPADANSVAIANGGSFGGSSSAGANSHASSVFGPASANSVAIANGKKL